MPSSLDVLENKMIFFPLSKLSVIWANKQVHLKKKKKKKDLTVCILSGKIQAR